MKFVLGTKLSMTQVFANDGRVVPVTRVQAGPCVVTQVVKEKTGAAVEVGFGEEKHASKPRAGHLKGLPAMHALRRFRVEELPETITRGALLSVAMFKPGDRVQVTGTSKGKGFQGVVKRHHFHGGPASHGHKDNARMPGSIGATGPQRVIKGMRMAGRMGGEQVSVQNLEVISSDPATNEIVLKGAVPGATGSLVVIAGKGVLEVIEPVAAEAPVEAVTASETPAAEPASPPEAGPPVAEEPVTT